MTTRDSRFRGNDRFCDGKEVMTIQDYHLDNNDWFFG